MTYKVKLESNSNIMVLSVELPFAGMENGFTNREGNVIGSFGLKKFLVESVTSNLLLHDVAPAYSPELSKSSDVLHLVLGDSFLRQPIRFKETFQQLMRIKQSVGILAITGSKNKHTIGSGRDWTTCWCL